MIFVPCELHGKRDRFFLTSEVFMKDDFKRALVYAAAISSFLGGGYTLNSVVSSFVDSRIVAMQNLQSAISEAAPAASDVSPKTVAPKAYSFGITIPK